MKSCEVKVIFFDYGGVIADEGFKHGLDAIAKLNGIEPEFFFNTARDLIHTTGYLTGKGDEIIFENMLRDQTGIKMNIMGLRGNIFDRFVIRKWMMDIIDELKKTTSGLQF